MFGHLNYVCPEKIRAVVSQMTEIRSIESLFITCDQVPLKIGNHLLEEIESYCYLGI